MNNSIQVYKLVLAKLPTVIMVYLLIMRSSLCCMFLNVSWLSTFLLKREPVHLKSPQTSKIMWQYISFYVSVTWTVRSWSGGHEFEPPSGWTWGAWYFCPKSYLNQKYRLPVRQSIWEPVHLKSPQTSKIMWQYISFYISVTWTVLSWSGGHEFEPRSGRTWGAWYFCPKSYLNQKYDRSSCL